MSILHPQECYLLEQSISVENYKRCYEAYKHAIEIAETRYDEVMRNIPLDYRNRPINQQLDITWGSRVLPNLRRTLAWLEKSYILRLHSGEWPAVAGGGGVRSDRKGMYADMGADLSWMGENCQQQFEFYFQEANQLDNNIACSTRNEWREGELTYNLSPNFGLVVPKRIPRYELVPDITLKTGERPKVAGLYLPDVDHAAATFLYPQIPNLEWSTLAFQGKEMKRFVNSNTQRVSYSWKSSDNVPCLWTLIRRVEGEYLDVPDEGFFPNHHPQELYSWPEHEKRYLNQQIEPRIIAWSGERCPHQGQWTTFMYRGVEFLHFEQDQLIPDWFDEYGSPQKVQWTLLERDDGGSPFVENFNK